MPETFARVLVGADEMEAEELGELTVISQVGSQPALWGKKEDDIVATEGKVWYFNGAKSELVLYLLCKIEKL